MLNLFQAFIRPILADFNVSLHGSFAIIAILVLVSWIQNSCVADESARFVSRIIVNYARTRQEWMSLTTKVPLLTVNLRARKPSFVPL